VAESDLTFLLHHLKSEDHISSFVLYLALQLHFRAVTQNEQGRAGKPCYYKDQRRQ
jgi:hypothetical protein